MAGNGSDVWAVGDFSNGFGQTLTLHWDGNTWSHGAEPTVEQNNNELTGVVGIGKDVWAVGQFDMFGDIYQTLTLHWDGSAWSQVTSPNLPDPSNNSPLTVVTGSGNDVWAVGYSNQVGLIQAITMHWDGNAWSMVPSPDPGIERQ